MKTTFKRPDILRPPSEHDDYFLPITNGCSHHNCTFCKYYGCKLQIREVDEIKSEIDAIALYMKSGITVPGIPAIVYYLLDEWDGRKIFLQDVDALIYPYPKLTEILEYLNEKLPDIERIACYGDPTGLLQKNVDDLKELKKLKLGIIYMGVESGDEDVLKAIGKDVNYDEMVRAGRKVKDSGITLSVSVILGLGGREGSQKHALATARILSDIDPEFCGALTLTLIPGTPLYEDAVAEKFHLITPFESLEELKIIVENVNFTDCFCSSMHASNYFTVRGKMPQEKERMLKQIEAVLKRRDPAMLRPEYLRGL